jgi:hypothetical protein
MEQDRKDHSEQSSTFKFEKVDEWKGLPVFLIPQGTKISQINLFSREMELIRSENDKILPNDIKGLFNDSEQNWMLIIDKAIERKHTEKKFIDENIPSKYYLNDSPKDLGEVGPILSEELIERIEREVKPSEDEINAAHSQIKREILAKMDISDDLINSTCYFTLTIDSVENV